MTTRSPCLSKSGLISAWQCPKKLHLEKHHPELGDITPTMESMFATGHQVGAIAQQLYGSTDSVEVPFNRNSGIMIQETRALLETHPRFPVFEATFRHENVLVRADVLIPSGDSWQVIEVKSSTSVKDIHVLDCAIQAWVMEQSGLSIKSISLAYINNQFVYQGDGNFAGLFIEDDLTDRVGNLNQEVADLVVAARNAVIGPMPDTRVGPQCTKPYECQFQTHCWPHDTEYPIAGLGGSKAKLAEYVALGHRDIRDVSSDSITAETQQRIHRITAAGTPEILAGGCHILSSLDFPRYYLDFETIAPAVPIWPGTRPYATLPVQWSCHIDDGTEEGGLRNLKHKEFLDLSGKPPMRGLADKLIECLGDSGPVLMYTSYEERVIRSLIELFPDLADPLQQIIDRLFDLHPVVKENYYHPQMLGSWSIKAVLPCIAPHMSYADLEGINEGTGAADGFVEAIAAETSRERKLELEDQLLRYCRFDTEAMVEIVRFFTKN
ncbi:MAG: DUF2779 domain-containing protein [Rhodothermales bacterium]|nr:DUF2779 domain-containing protein [Rhodothermales bacterium]